MNNDNEAKDHENANETNEIHKKGRQRKKQLYNSILQQMEFYFSDSNLTKDRFLSQLLQKDPEVDLNVFLKFNKIRKWTTNIDHIRKAIKNSKLIQLSDDGNRIKRKEPVKVKSNVDECTIYVERLKSEATHEWLNSVFSEFGTVVYVSIPKYKNNNAIKGFAFVEFDKEEEAEKALSYFESIGCKMPSSVEPEELCSIATFEDGSHETQSTEDTTLENQSSEKGNKRKYNESEEADSEDKSKKLKLETGDASESEDPENKKKKKHKKEHKKKNYIKDLGLQVLSKKEWKKMRNRYLDLQKKKMKEFKKHLNKARFSQANYEDKNKKDESTEEKIIENSASKIEFVEGVIIKLVLPEPCIDIKKFKNELKTSCSDIKYVEIPNPGSEVVYVRFGTSATAKNFCNQGSAFAKTLLEGEEEKAYWDKLFAEREEKFKKSNKKQRGRDKLLKKANKIMASHIKFDE